MVEQQGKVVEELVFSVESQGDLCKRNSRPLINLLESIQNPWEINHAYFIGDEVTYLFNIREILLTSILLTGEPNYRPMNHTIYIGPFSFISATFPFST